ncbi:MAG: ImmA/IrrE family metallo-endopeptidase [Desulforudis sp.]|nr:MAG: ImmA/IrrE family metallo-endopeptidase [Desulforudis sp.]
MSRFRRTQQLPSIPRKERSIRIARQFIIESDTRQLPVNPFSLYAQHHDWLLYTCSRAEQIYGRPDPLNLIRARADARTLRTRDTGTYVTVHKATARANRVRWTLAHEIGHIVLSHLTDFEATCLCRGGLTTREYRVLEREADLFAAELLMPMMIIKALGVTTAPAIARICLVSGEAARNRVSELGLWRYKPGALSTALRNQFRQFLAGEQERERRPSAMATDGNGRYICCPRCRNTAFSPYARHCRVCGLYLYNDCDRCGKRNLGDVRYCEYCGAKTPLLQMGFLTTASQDEGAKRRLVVAADDCKQMDSLLSSAGRVNRARS